MRVKSRPQSSVAKFVMSPSFQDHMTKKRRALGTRTDFAHVQRNSHTAEVPRSRALLTLVLHLFRDRSLFIAWGGGVGGFLAKRDEN